MVFLFHLHKQHSKNFNLLPGGACLHLVKKYDSAGSLMQHMEKFMVRKTDYVFSSMAKNEICTENSKP